MITIFMMFKTEIYRNYSTKTEFISVVYKTNGDVYYVALIRCPENDGTLEE